MCGLIEGIADQVRFLSAAEPSPRLTPVFSSLQKKRKKKKTAQAARVTLEKSSTNISHSPLMPTRTIIYATQNVLVRMPQTCKCKKAAGVNRSALPPELNERREHKTHVPWTTVLQPSQEWRKTCKLDWFFFIFLIRRLYFPLHFLFFFLFFCLSCLTHSDSVLAWTSKNMVICISLSEWSHLGLHGRRWNSAGEPTKRRCSKLSAAGVCKDFLNMTGADTVGLGVWALVAVRENSDLPQTWLITNYSLLLSLLMLLTIFSIVSRL